MQEEKKTDRGRNKGLLPDRSAATRGKATLRDRSLQAHMALPVHERLRVALAMIIPNHGRDQQSRR